MTGAGSPRLLYAGANGPAVTSTLTGTFGPLSRASGQSLTSIDLVPLAAGDRRGLSTFYVIFGVVLAGFLFGQMLPQLKRRPRVLVVIATTVVFGLLAGLGIGLLGGGLGFGAVPVSLGGAVALGGLLTCAVAATTTAFVRLLGAAGRLAAVVLLVILGGASSGAVLPPPYLPGWLHPLAMALPPGLAARALQGMAYFHNDGLVSGVIILSTWIAASAVVLLLVDWRSQARNNGKASLREGGPP